MTHRETPSDKRQKWSGATLSWEVSASNSPIKIKEKGGVFPAGLRGSVACLHPDFELPTSRTGRRWISSRHPVCGILSWQSQETDTGSKGQSKPDLSSYLVTEFRGFSLYSKPNAFRIFFVFLKTEISLYRTELGSKSLLLSLKPLKLTWRFHWPVLSASQN